jgi:hypothetical protein
VTTATLVVFGPQGCGKTINAPAIARHFGLAQVQEWDEIAAARGRPPKPADGVLLLCTPVDVPQLQQRAPQLRFVSFAAACQAAGISDPLAAVRGRRPATMNLQRLAAARISR